MATTVVIKKNERKSTRNLLAKRLRAELTKALAEDDLYDGDLRDIKAAVSQVSKTWNQLAVMLTEERSIAC